MTALFRVWDGVVDLMAGEHGRAVAKLSVVLEEFDEHSERWPMTVARLARATALDPGEAHQDAATEAAAALDSLPVDVEWFGDLIAYQVLTVATARLGSLDQAARHLGRLLALARDRYSHIGNGTGTAVVSAGALLAARGELGPSRGVPRLAHDSTGRALRDGLDNSAALRRAAVKSARA